MATKEGCTKSQLDDMLEGHFSLSQQLYADDSAVMESNQTVGEWKSQYSSVDKSHYGSYAYDAGKKIIVFVFAIN